MIIITSDYSSAYAELDRLIAMPTPKVTAGMDLVLEGGFEEARGRVHVITGRLKASGRKSSKTTSAKWEGMFSFGNSTVVDYAIYEKERDQSHDFFSEVHLLKVLFKVALLKGLAK